MSDGLGVSQRDKILVVVPQFHAMSWGIPHAAFMVGASLVMPDQFLQPEPIARMMAVERPTRTGAVPTVWTGLLQHLESHPQDISHLDEVVCGGAAVPRAPMHAFHDQPRIEVIQAWRRTETSPLASVAGAPGTVAGDDAWQYRYPQGRLVASVSGRFVSDAGEVLPWDGSSVGELQVAGPWSPAPTTAAPIRRSFTTVGCARATSPPHTGRLPDADRPRQGRHQVRRRVDLVGRAGERCHGPSRGRRGRRGGGHRRPRREVGRAPAGRGRPAMGQPTSAAELRRSLADRVAKWQLPDYWTFVDEIPKTSVGKFDKKRLRTDHSQGRLDLSTVT